MFFRNKKNDIDLVEWDIKRGQEIKSSGNEVLEQVLSGLKLVNEELGKNYCLSKIFFLPSDSASNSVYEFLIQVLINQFDSGSEFLEV